MADRGTFEAIAGEVGQALLPLRDALSSPQSFFAFLQKLGWRADGIPPPLAELGAGLDGNLAARAIIEGVQADVGGDAVEPRAQRRPAVEAVEVSPGPHHGLLDGVVGVERRAEHAVTEIGRAHV